MLKLAFRDLRFQRLGAMRASFSPASLFASGAKGVWFDPNDLPTLTQVSDGTVPVTAAGQPVGTMIDKSDKESAVAGVRPNLLLFPDDFNNAVWTKQAGITTTGSQLAPDGSSTAQRVDFGVADRALSQDLVVPAGNYTTVLSIKGVAGETIRIKPGMNPESIRTLTGDWQTIVVGAKGVISSFNLNTYGGVTARTIYVWSPKFETGLYATQAVASKRPIYGVIPKGGRRNLLQSSVTPFVAGATGTSAVVNAAIAPDGTLTATKIAESTSNQRQRRHANVTITANTWHTFTVQAKAAERSHIGVVYGQSSAPFIRAGMIVNLTTGAVTDYSNGTVLGVTRHPPVMLAGGWWRISISVLIDATTTAGYLELWPADNGVVDYLGDGVSGVYVWSQQFGVGSTPNPDQRVVSAYDITEVGVPPLPYLASDLIDDQLPATVLSLGSNATVWFAVDGASTILTGQTVAAGPIATLRGERTYTMGAIDRPLSAGETVALTTYLDKARGAL